MNEKTYQKADSDISSINILGSFLQSNDEFLETTSIDKKSSIAMKHIIETERLSDNQKNYLKSILEKETVSLMSIMQDAHLFELIYTYECFIHSVMETDFKLEENSIYGDEGDEHSIKVKEVETSFENLGVDFITKGSYEPIKLSLHKIDRAYCSMTNSKLKWVWLAMAIQD